MPKIVSIKPVGRMPVYNMFVNSAHNYITPYGTVLHNCDAIRYWTASRPRGGTEAVAEKYPINSLEYRVQKNLDKLTKKTRRTSDW